MAELPDEVVDEAARLTRIVLAVTDSSERTARRTRRDDLLAEYGFVARVREDDDSDVLVCYPSDWIENGEVRVDRIENLDRGVERRLTAATEFDDWGALATHNQQIADRVRDGHGDVHGATALAFAAFMSNHHVTRIEAATDDHRAEFRTEYFVRNAWPTDKQKAVVDTSLSLVADVAAAIGNGTE